MLKGCWQRIGCRSWRNPYSQRSWKKQTRFKKNHAHDRAIKYCSHCKSGDCKGCLERREVDLLKRLIQMKLSDSGSVQEYVGEMIMMSLKVQQSELKLDDELISDGFAPS